MMKVTRIECPLYASNVYMLEDDSSDKVWLVDIGTANLPIPDGKSVAGVFITHTHIDHIQGINDLLRRYPECIVYTNEAGKEGFYNDRINLTYYHEQPLNFIGGDVLVIKEGDRIQLFKDVEANIVESPGHHPSCLTFIIGDYLFTGDAYIPGTKVVTNLPSGNKELANQSIDKIKRLAQGLTICPGHSVV